MKADFELYSLVRMFVKSAVKHLKLIFTCRFRVFIVFPMHYYIAHDTLETVLLESFLFQHVSVVRVIYSPSTNQVS